MNPSAPARRAGVFDVGVAGVGSTECDVLPHGCVHDEVVLQHDGHLAAQPLQVQLTDVAAVQKHATGVGVVQPQQQARDRGLACPVRPDECGDPTWRDRQRGVAKGRWSGSGRN